MTIFLILLLFVPAAFAAHYLFDAPPILVFALSAAAIATLAEWIRRSTDQLAQQVGPAIGGLLTITFGSIAEFVLAIFVLLRGQASVVQAQIAGSILATSLFGLGLAALVGGLFCERQRFKPERAGLLSSLLILTVIALILPAVFDLHWSMTAGGRQRRISDEELSLGVSVVLLVLYGANLVYTLVTHRSVFASDEPKEGEASWSLPLSLGVLIGATALIALEADVLSSTLEKTASSLSLSPVFLGVIVLAMVGTAADVFAAAWFARQDKMTLVFEISIGSAIQVALVLAPLLVLVSFALGQPMTLVFANPLYLFGIASTALIVNSVARDGETTWFEGLLLIGVYGLFALAFFFAGPSTEG